MTDIGDLFDLDVKDEFNKKSKVSLPSKCQLLLHSSPNSGLLAACVSANQDRPPYTGSTA